MYEESFPKKRFQKTLVFLQKHIPREARILDLGVDNPLAQLMRKAGYTVENTGGEDLDLEFHTLLNSTAEVVTAFEIFEHLLAPFNALQKIKAHTLVASVPLKLWFANAYRSQTDPWDRHFHEFEPWQFDWLLEKSGWKVIASEKWAHPVRRVGIRPFLRTFTPRYYLVCAKRITEGL